MATQAHYAVAFDDQGRLVLPADLGERLGLHPGDRLIAIVDADNAVRFVSADEQAKQLFGLYRHLATNRSVVDEFLAERRQESARENNE